MNSNIKWRDEALIEALREAQNSPSNLAIVRNGEGYWLVGKFHELKKDWISDPSFRLITPCGHVWKLS